MIAEKVLGHRVVRKVLGRKFEGPVLASRKEAARYADIYKKSEGVEDSWTEPMSIGAYGEGKRTMKVPPAKPKL